MMAASAMSTPGPGAFDQHQEIAKPIADQMLATVYGQCVGDALGLLTEFMEKDEAKRYYGAKPKDLEYAQKVPDMHRMRWKEGDWTDDTDHMIVIMQSILYNKGQVIATDFAERIKRWMNKGFPELGDFGGMGIGATTSSVLKHKEYVSDPHRIAYECWDRSQRNIAPNGAVMRTSILGLHQWNDLQAVSKNALEICKTTHHDPRCQASSVAVSVCIACMLQHTAGQMKLQGYPRKVDQLIKLSYDMACEVLETDEQRKELKFYLFCTKLKDLKLSERGKIGYTYKCLGAGFWALKQGDFKKAMIKLVMQGGDADTNGAVAGALLACKLGVSAIPESWISGLKHTEWMLGFFNRFLHLQSEMSLPIEKRTPNDDLNIKAMDAEMERKKREISDQHSDKNLTS